MMRGLRVLTVAGLGLLLGVSLAGSASAGTIPTACDPAVCSWSVTVQGYGVVASGGFDIDDEGNISPVGDTSWDDGAGSSIIINSVSGNVDPEIVFGLGATNNTGGILTYAFSFSLPLGGFSGPASTFASLLGSITSASTGAGSIFPTSGTGFIVDSQDIRLSPFLSLDKGVDIGTAVTGTAGVPVGYSFTDSDTLVGGPFDVMSVIVAFGISDPAGAGATAVGMSGIVRQLAIPEPSAMLLLGAGLAAAALRRRSA